MSTMQAMTIFWVICLAFFLGMLIGSAVGKDIFEASAAFAGFCAGILTLMGMYQWGKNSK